MSNKQLFEAFSEEQQEEYARQAERMYDPEIVRASNRKWQAYTAEQKKCIMDEGNRVYVDMVAAMPKGEASFEVQAIVERWRRHMEYFWTPNLEQLLGLTEGLQYRSALQSQFCQNPPRSGIVHERSGKDLRGVGARKKQRAENKEGQIAILGVPVLRGDCYAR